MSEEITQEQLDGLRDLAENLTGKKLGNVKDPSKLQSMIDTARLEAEEAEKNKPQSTGLKGKAERRVEARKKATKLVRCNVTAMAPFEKQLQGTFFDVGNSVVGSIRRYIPFDVDWHCEEMLLNHIKERKYRTKHEWKDPTTRKTMYENRFHKAFGVVVIDDLSPEELERHNISMKSRAYGQS